MATATPAPTQETVKTAPLTLTPQAIAKVREGVTTLKEINKVTFIE